MSGLSRKLSISLPAKLSQTGAWWGKQRGHGGANKEEVKKSVDVVETAMGEHAAAAAHKENEGKPATTRVQCLPIGVPIFEAMASTILQEF